MKSNLRICPQCGTETTALTCRNDGFGTVDAGRYRKHDPASLIGTLFQDRYRVDGVLGSGGMGSVYRATQVRVGRQVALKVINAELAWDLAVVARFQREGRAIAALIHPNIVQVYDFGQTDEGQLFMAMELVGGKTLADVIREEAPLDPTRVVHIGSQIFDALAEAHEHGVIHRDLKPENIFVSETGRRRDVVKIVDFGVAKIVNEPKTESMVTARGAILGSPKYMAPEQARGKGVTGHADLYAVGGIMYEMLTGRSVYNEPSPADYLVAHSVKMPNPPELKGQELRGPLVDLIMKCLEKKPWNRPDGAARALEALEAARLTPIIDAGDNAPLALRDVPANQDQRPRRLVKSPTGILPAVEVPPADGHAVAPPPLPPGVTEAAPLPPMAPRARHEPPTSAVADLKPEVAPAAVDTKRVGQRDEVPLAAGIITQDDPTIIAEAEPATPAELRRAAGEVVVVERRSSGGLWLLAALLLLAVGVIWYLSQSGFFAPSGRVARTAAKAPEVEPVQRPPRPELVAASDGPGQAGGPTAPLPTAGDPPTEPGSAVVTGAVAGSEGGAASVTGADATGGDAAAIASADAAAGDDAGSAAAATAAPELPASSPVVAPVAAPKAPETPAERAAREDRAKARAEAKAKAAAAAAQAAEEAANQRKAQEAEARAQALRDAAAKARAERAAAAPAIDGVMKVLVSSEPSGAQIMMGALPVGKTPLNLEWKDSGQKVTITVTYPGYKPQRATLSAAQPRLSLELQPEEGGVP